MFDNLKLVILKLKLMRVLSYSLKNDESTLFEEDSIWESLPDNVLNGDLKPRTFRVAVKRSMPLPFKSTELEREIGARLLRRGIGIKVKMVDPELVVDLEFCL